jgi:hypothetical protein
MPEFGVSFNYDDGGISKSIADQAEQLKKVNKELLGYEKEINNIAKSSVKALNDTEKALIGQTKAQIDNALQMEDNYNRVKTQIGEIAIALTRSGVNAEKFNAIIKKLSDARANGLSVDIDELNNEFSQLIDNAGLTSEQLKIMEYASDEVVQVLSLIAASDISNLSDQAETLTKEFVNSKAELRKLTALINSGQLEGSELIKAKERAAELTDSIGDTRDEIKAMSSDTRTFDLLSSGLGTIAQGFQLAEGAAALFGDENEDVQKALLKLNAIMAINNSLNEISKDITTKGTLANKLAAGAQALWATAIGASSGAMRIFRVVLASTGIGLIVLLIGSLVANWSKLKGAITESVPALGKFGETWNTVKAIAFGVLGGIFGYLKTVAQVIGKLFERDLSGAIDAAKDLGKNIASGFVEGQSTELKNQEKKALSDNLKSIVEGQKQKLAVLEASGKDTYALQSKIIKNEIAQLKAAGSEKEQIAEKELELEVLKAGRNKELLDKQNDAYKKYIDEIKSLNNDLLKSKRENELSGIDTSTPDGQKARLELEQKFALEDLALAKEVSLEKARGAKDRADIEELYKAIEYETVLQYSNKILDIERQVQRDRIKAEKEEYQELEKLSKEYEKNQADKTKKDKEDGIKTRIAYKNAQIEAANAEIESGNITIARRRELELTKRRLAIETLELELSLIEDKTSADAINIQAQINNVNNQAKELQNAGQGIYKSFDDLLKEQTSKLFEGVASEDQIDALLEGFKQIKEAVLEIVQAGYEAEIEALDKSIDYRKDKISELEGLIEDEFQKKQNGYNNSYDALSQAKLNEEELLRQDNKKRLEIKKSQLKAETAIQAAEQTGALITAVANVVKDGSKYGVFGIPLIAASLIGLFAIFRSYKTKVNALTADQAYKGGLISDYLTNGNTAKSDRWGYGGHRLEGTNLNIGADEFLVNAKTTGKHLPFLKMLNSGKLDNSNILSMLENTPNDRVIIADVGESMAKKELETKIELEKSIHAQTEKLIEATEKLGKKLIEDNSRRPTVIHHTDGTVETIHYEKNGITRRIKKP